MQSNKRISMKKNQITQPTSPELNHHRKKAIKLINQLTKTEKSKKSQQLQYKVRTLYEINKEIQASMKRNPILAEVFATDQLIIYIRYYFVQNISRCPCLTFFRLIMVSQDVTKKYLSHNIPIYIARLIQKQQPKSKNINHEDQIYEALKLMADWVSKFPSTFPKLLLSTLISFSELPVVQGFQQRKKDHIPVHLKQQAIDILINLSSKSTKMFAFSGGFTLLSNAMLDPVLHDKSQSIVYRFIYFFNEKKNRDYVSDYINLKKMFSIFTDLDNTFLEDSSKSKGNMENSTKFQKQLELGKKGILSLIKSWTGIIYLGYEDFTLRSFLEALKQIPKKQDSQVRRVIFSIIQEILSIGDNLISTQTFLFAENQFRVTNLVNCYVVTLIQLLLENDLFKILIELSGVEQSMIAEPSQKLLKKLSIYIFNFLPDCSKYIDFLISAATKMDKTSLILKSSSSFIMSKIGNYIYDNSSSKIINQQLNQLQSLFNLNSIYVSSGRSNINAIAKTLNMITSKEKENQRVQLINQNPIPKQHKEDYKKWNWDVIQQIFVFPDRFKDNLKLDSHQKHKQSKILKYMLRFYSHTRGSFSELKWSSQNLQIIKVGKLFIRSAITIPQMLPLVKNPPQSQFECTVSFMGELQKLLETTLIGCTKIRNNFYQPFFKNLQRQLLLWIGLFSENKVGYEVLLCENNFFQLLYEFIDKPECSLVIFALMMYLDFYRQNMNKNIQNYRGDGESKYVLIGPKVLLKRCIKQGSKQIQILSLEIIKLLFKAQLPAFPNEGFKMLLYLMAIQNQEIRCEVLECIEYLLREKQNIPIFLSCLMQQQSKKQSKFSLIYQKLQQSKTIFIRLISIEIGYNFLTKTIQNNQWLEHQYKKWLNIHQNNYCLTLQNLLNETLNFVSKPINEYKIENCRTIYELGFLYKLPWIIYLNDQQIPAYAKMTKNRFILYYNFQNSQNYESLQQYQDKTFRVSLGIGSQYVNESLKFVKDKVIKDISLANLYTKYLYGEKLLCVSDNGITIYMSQLSQQLHIREQSESQMLSFCGYQIKRIELDIKIYFDQQNQQLPLHLVQELTKTQLGLQFLIDKEFLSHAENILDSQEATPLQLRSTLWSLGYYGSNKLGISQLIQNNIADKIIHLSFNCDVLSLRGTCRYILNMFCHSQTGRNFMISRGFVVNKKSLNCFPKQDRKFYQMKKTNYVHFSLNCEYWKKYSESLKPMTQNETKLFNLISQLINALSYKQSITSVKQMMKNSIKVIHSLNLLQNVINLLSFYKFRNDARKNIYMIFQEFFRSPDFNTNTQNKITYVTSQQIQNIQLQIDQEL